MDSYREIIGIVGNAINVVGVGIIFFGILMATGRVLFQRRGNRYVTYQSYRQDIGRAILLGLEFLIAGDIIRTVVESPSLRNVAVLAIIVLIRTFLSTSLQLELEGRWPWQLPRRQ